MKSPRFALGLRHLLLYTAALGICLTLYRIVAELVPEYPPEVALLGHGYSYALMAMQAVGVAALLLWLSGLEARSGKFPAQPGHWLLIADGLAGLIGAGAQILTLELLAPQGKQTAQFYAMFAFQIAAAPCYVAVLTSAMRAYPISKPWQAVLCLALGGQIFAGLWSLPLFFTSYFYWNDLMPWHVAPHIGTLEAIVLVIAIAIDRRAQQSRDWLHWLAIVVWFLAWAKSWVWYVVQLQYW